MLNKKFAGSLLILVALLGFSATGVMGADILFVTSTDAEHMPGDDAIKAFLESLGHTVTYIDDDDGEADTEAAALASDVVYISESVSSGRIRDEITEIATPIIVAEPYAWDEMGLIVSSGSNQAPNSAAITIIDPQHPMAAGYSGDVIVFSDLSQSPLIPVGTTGGGAVVIARASGDAQANADVYFLYEQGAALAQPANDGSGSVAAGIRIGFFAASPGSQQLLTQEGLDLLEAAVNYALGLTGDADLAGAPSPGNGSTYVPYTVTLSWAPGERAERHDVYLGTNFDDVNQADTSSTAIYLDTVDANSYGPLSLEGGTTYYWRIDEVNEGTPGSPWKGRVWTFDTTPLVAHNPRPEDGQDASIPLVLKWTAGGDVTTHELYFGTTADSLTHRATRPAEDPTYAIYGLEVGETYYWRVDEAGAGGTYTGDVWSFTVTRRVTNVWLEAELADEVRYPMQIFPDPDDGEDPVAEANAVGQPSGGSYIGTTPSESGNNDFWTLDGATYTFTVPAGTYTIWARVSDLDDDSFWLSIPDGQYDVEVDPSGWILFVVNPASPDWHWVRVRSDTDPSNAFVNVTLTAGQHTMELLHRENENFMDGILITNDLSLQAADLPDVIPEMTYTEATNANPPDGAVDVRQDVVLSWRAGSYVDGLSPQHRVFFSENFDDVNGGVGGVEQDIEYYPASGTLDLELEKTYYWRVDEANSASGWDEGAVWRFTVGNFLVIDDVEDYNDTPPETVWNAWRDGFGDATNGSQVGHDDPGPYAEHDIVHTGTQSMPLYYDNSEAGLSEATKTLTSVRDWTEQGVEALSLWFRGYPAPVGSFTEAPAGTYTITATGTDIWLSADEFHFAYKQLTGVGSIQARVLSVENTDDWANAGVMIRETLEPGSKFALVYITPTQADGVTAEHGVRYKTRAAADTDAVSDTDVATDEQMALTTPYWIRLERDIGGNFRGYYSSDGSSWQLMQWGPRAIQMPTTVYIGLAVTAHNAEATCEAQFSNVTFSENVSGEWMHQDIGILSNDAESMYVAVANNTGTPAVVYHDDSNAAQIDDWTEWNIDLKDFEDQGVTLTDVNSIVVGLGNRADPQAGGGGIIYYDDIRLYRPRCVPEKTTLLADLSGDCVVDFEDLEMMADDWLAGEAEMAADINDDSEVGLKDFAALADEWLDEQKSWPQP